MRRAAVESDGEPMGSAEHQHRDKQDQGGKGEQEQVRGNQAGQGRADAGPGDAEDAEGQSLAYAHPGRPCVRHQCDERGAPDDEQGAGRGRVRVLSRSATCGHRPRSRPSRLRPGSLGWPGQRSAAATPRST